MFSRLIFELPIKTVSEANASEHWTVKSRRHHSQQRIIRYAMAKHADVIRVPCTVRLIRVSPGLLDSDNLLTAFKWIRDEISELILPDKKKSYTSGHGKTVSLKGRCDDDPRITWQYDQCKGRVYAVLIEIIFPDETTCSSLDHKSQA